MKVRRILTSIISISIATATIPYSSVATAVNSDVSVST